MKRRRAFTLPEILLAMAITSIIGLAVAGASMALSSGYAASQNQYESTQGARSAVRQIRYRLNRAQLITAIGDGGKTVVYWSGDDNNNGKMNKSEMRCLRLEGSDLKEYRIEFPDGWPGLLETMMDSKVELDEATNLSQMVALLLNNTYSTSKTIAGDVQAFGLTPETSPPLTRLANLTVTVGTGDSALTLRTAVACRAPAAEYVGKVASSWVLELPWSRWGDLL